ncbi:MAG: YbjN domain-containing protein [Acidimicrobiia bacterium]
MTVAFDGFDLDALELRISMWLADQLETNPVVLAVDRGEPGERRWYVRMAGEEKDFITIWITLGQRTLAFETYVMPAPEENHEMFYEQALRRSRNLVGVQFAIGEEDALFLVGHLAVTGFSEDELDRVIGTMYATVELCFMSLLRVGYASRFIS